MYIISYTLDPTYTYLLFPLIYSTHIHMYTHANTHTITYMLTHMHTHASKNPFPYVGWRVGYRKSLTYITRELINVTI